MNKVTGRIVSISMVLSLMAIMIQIPVDAEFCVMNDGNDILENFKTNITADGTIGIVGTDLEIDTGTSGNTFIDRTYFTLEHGTWINITYKITQNNPFEKNILIRISDIFAVFVNDTGQIGIWEGTYTAMDTITLGTWYNITIYLNVTTDKVGVRFYAAGSWYWEDFKDPKAPNDEVGELKIGNIVSSLAGGIITLRNMTINDAEQLANTFSLTTPPDQSGYTNNIIYRIDSTDDMHPANPHSNYDGEYQTATNNHVNTWFDNTTVKSFRMYNVAITDRYLIKWYINITPVQASQWLNDSLNDVIYIRFRMDFENPITTTFWCRWIMQNSSSGVVWNDYLLNEFNTTSQSAGVNYTNVNSIQYNVTINRSICDDFLYNYNNADGNNETFLYFWIGNNFNRTGHSIYITGNHTNYNGWINSTVGPDGFKAGDEMFWDAIVYTRSATTPTTQLNDLLRDIIGPISSMIMITVGLFLIISLLIMIGNGTKKFL